MLVFSNNLENKLKIFMCFNNSKRIIFDFAAYTCIILIANYMILLLQ
jgi:hypothetical protein